MLKKLSIINKIIFLDGYNNNENRKTHKHLFKQAQKYWKNYLWKNENELIWLDKGEIRLTDALLADIKKEKSYYGNTFFSLYLAKDNETYKAVAFVGKEEVISLEERIERKLNSFVRIKNSSRKQEKTIMKWWKN